MRSGERAEDGRGEEVGTAEEKVEQTRERRRDSGRRSERPRAEAGGSARNAQHTIIGEEHK